MDSSEPGKVSVPTNLNAQENPLLHKLTPQQFAASVKFYEADKQLTPEDRQDIAVQLREIITKNAFTSYFLGIGTFFAPTVYEKFFRKGGPQAPKQLKTVINPDGKPVLVGPVKTLVHKPFLSFAFGCAAMMISSNFLGHYQFQRKVQAFENFPNDEAKQRQGNVWKVMDPPQSTLFFLYYKNSAQDPNFIVRDPRTITRENLHKVSYRPPSTENKHEHFTSALGIGYSKPENSSDSPEGLRPPPSHWDQIRSSNAFTPESYEAAKSQSKDEKDDAFAVDTSIPKFSPAPEPESSSLPSPPASAWDAIRQRNSK